MAHKILETAQSPNSLFYLTLILAGTGHGTCPWDGDMSKLGSARLIAVKKLSFSQDLSWWQTKFSVIAPGADLFHLNRYEWTRN